MITTSQKARLCEMAQQLKPMPITRKLLSKKLKKERMVFIGLWSSFICMTTITN